MFKFCFMTSLLHYYSPKMLSCFRNHAQKIKEDNFVKNGAIMLEQVITSFNGNCNPIRIYSMEELNKATDNFHWDKILHLDALYIMYEGVHEYHRISVKIFESKSLKLERDTVDEIANEFAIASLMSKHNNVLKLLGYCLETEVPILVYEFPVNGHLPRKIESLPWQTKLRIAIGIANAVAYLHYGFSKIIIHRDLKLGHIFLDQDYVPKLSEFQMSITIPEGETHVYADIGGTQGHIAPEVADHGRHTEKCDVYYFGILLCEIITGMRTGDLIMSTMCGEFSDSEESEHYLIGLVARYCEAQFKANNNWLEENKNEVMECVKLIEKCLRTSPDDRLNMIEIAKALTALKNNC